MTKLGAHDKKDSKVVWILGAGFSRPLNLPLASELFTERYGRLGQGFAAPFTYEGERLRLDLHPTFAELSNCLKQMKARATHRAPDTDAIIAHVRSAVGDARATLATLDGRDAKVEGYLKSLDEFCTGDQCDRARHHRQRWFPRSRLTRLPCPR